MELRFRQLDWKPVAEVSVPKKLESRIKVPDLSPSWLPMIDDYNRQERSRRQPPKDNRPQIPLYIDDEPPPDWRPTDRKPPDEERGVIILEM